jgi:serine/threonine-protein kinase
MQTPEQAASEDEFEGVLRELARPEAPGDAFAQKLAAVSTHPLREALQEAPHEAGSVREPRPGDVLDGRYRINSVLGRGGMGLVLEAEHLRAHKLVAIKWMSNRGLERSEAQIARFLREARAVANIQHPNVVDLYDVGDNLGTPFLVLERLSGESLRARLGRGPLSWPELEPIMLGVLRGVEAVHRAGIVHRDLKPDNIYLARDGDSLVPKVLDFGVAAIHASTDQDLNSLTNTGAVLGTPAYMALEQLTSGEVGARADLYALGVVMYEALSGRLPFEVRSAPELAVRLATSEPTPLAQLVPGLDRRVEALIMRLLARAPEQRPAHVGELIAALAAARAPVDARRGWWLAGGALLVLGLAGIAVLQTGSVTRDEREVTASPSAARVEAVESAREEQLAAPAVPAPVVQVDATSAAEPSSPVKAAADTREVAAPSPRRVKRQLVGTEPRAAVDTNARAPEAEPTPMRPKRDATKIQLDDF